MLPYVGVRYQPVLAFLLYSIELVVLLIVITPFAEEHIQAEFLFIQFLLGLVVFLFIPGLDHFFAEPLDLSLQGTDLLPLFLFFFLFRPQFPYHGSAGLFMLRGIIKKEGGQLLPVPEVVQKFQHALFWKGSFFNRHLVGYHDIGS